MSKRTYVNTSLSELSRFHKSTIANPMTRNKKHGIYERDEKYKKSSPKTKTPKKSKSKIKTRSNNNNNDNNNNNKTPKTPKKTTTKTRTRTTTPSSFRSKTKKKRKKKRKSILIDTNTKFDNSSQSPSNHSYSSGLSSDDDIDEKTKIMSLSFNTLYSRKNGLENVINNKWNRNNHRATCSVNIASKTLKRHPHSPQNSLYYNHSSSLKGYKLSEILNIKKEHRLLSSWSKMEIAEWLQFKWNTSSTTTNKTKLLSYINKIKREKKFDGKNIDKLNDRDLNILAQRYLGLKKGENDYNIFIKLIYELKSKYSVSTTPIITTPKKRKINNNNNNYNKSRRTRHRSRTFPQIQFQLFQKEEIEKNNITKNENKNKEIKESQKTRKLKESKQLKQLKEIKKKSNKLKGKQLKLTIHDEKSNKINRRKNSKTFDSIQIETERRKYYHLKTNKKIIKRRNNNNNNNRNYERKKIINSRNNNRNNRNNRNNKAISIRFDNKSPKKEKRTNNNNIISKTPKRCKKRRRIKRSKRSISTIETTTKTRKKCINIDNIKKKKKGKKNENNNNNKRCNVAPFVSARSCPPSSSLSNDNNNNNSSFNELINEYSDDLGLVILEQNAANNNNLQFSITSPAGSPSPCSKIEKEGLINNYDGVTADELLELISIGHADEIDTDYDTDTNIGDYYNEYISETPSPKEINDTFPNIYNMHRLQLLSSNSANNSNLSNVSTSISLQSIPSSSSNIDKDEIINIEYNQKKFTKKSGGNNKNTLKHFRFIDNSDDDNINNTEYITECKFTLKTTDLDHTKPVNDLSLSYGTSSDSVISTEKIEKELEAIHNKHTTMVIPSIFAIDDTECLNDDKYPPKIALSPIISSDQLKSEDRGLLLNMMCYSMTDESTDEEDNNNYHRNSTVKQTLQTTKRIIQYALHNSPPVITGNTTFDNIPTNTPSIPQLTTSQTGLAVLDDIAEFVNDSGIDHDD